MDKVATKEIKEDRKNEREEKRLKKNNKCVVCSGLNNSKRS